MIGKKMNMLLLCALLAVACKKYAPAPDISGAAYLRIFNDIPFTLTLANKEQVVPFFTVIIDPDINAAGVPTGGKVVGDYLGSRQPFNTSTSSNEGNALGTSLDTTIKYNINYEYPGNAHVLTAPSINGLDLSAWAQVSSGKHRVLFITRPKNYIDYAFLSDTIKKKIVIDTTIDLQEGEVYTMEAVLQDVDAVKYGIYLRQENFTHQAFDANKNYVSFYNLSGKKSVLASLPISPSSGYFYDTMSVYYTYYTVTPGFITSPGNTTTPYSSPIPAYSGLALTTLDTRMPGSASWYPLPVLPLSYFYDLQGNLRTYNDVGGVSGTMPYFVFSFLALGNNVVDGSGTNQQYSLFCDFDPNTVNNTLSFQLGSHTANLNMLVENSGQVRLYPAVYIMELVFNQIYLMQVQRKL